MIKWYCALFLLFLTPFLSAQVSRSGTFEDTAYLVGNYEVTLSDAYRIDTKPKLETPEVISPEYIYQLKLSKAEVPKLIDLPKAEKMAKSQMPVYKNSFVKVGFGNYITPLVDAYFHNGAHNKNAFALNLHHLSSQGPNFNDFNQNRVGLDFKRAIKQGTFYTNTQWNREAYHFYGFDESLLPSPVQDSLRNWYQIIQQNIGYDLVKGNKILRALNMNGKAYFLNDLTKQQEIGIGLSGTGDIKIADHILSLGLNYDFQGFISSLDTLYRNIISFSPTYKYKHKTWFFEAGVLATILSEDNRKPDFYMFPKISGKYLSNSEAVELFANIGGGLVQNTFKQFIEQNPFIQFNPNLTNTVNRFQFDAGIKGRISHGIGAGFTVFHHNYYDFPLFITANTPERRFVIENFDMNVTRINALLNLNLQNRFTSTLEFNYFNYSFKGINQPLAAYLMPNLEIISQNKYSIAEKLILNVDLFVFGKRKALEQTKIDLIELRPFFDANLGADYRWKKNISAFIRINNLSGNKYQRWTYHPVYGINFLAGLTFSL